MKTRSGEVRLDGSGAADADVARDRARRVEDVATGGTGNIGLSLRVSSTNAGIARQTCHVCGEVSTFLVTPEAIENGTALDGVFAIAWLEVFQRMHRHEETFS